MNSHIVDFLDALASAGVHLAAGTQIIPDGKLHRVKLADDRAGQLTGWYRLHLDEPVAGAGGDWRKGISTRWCSKRESSLSSKERAALATRILRERAEAQAEQKRRHADATRIAGLVWNSAKPAEQDHPYLTRKQIPAGIARQSGGALILPITGFDGELRGLQTIGHTGEKRFTRGMHKAGGFIRTDKMPSADTRLIIAEGWATAMSLAELSPGACVVAALDCGNMQAVAVEARHRFPHIDLVIAADADQVGMKKAKAAAIAAHAKWVWPRFPKDAPEGLSDFNDWVVWCKSQREGVCHV